MYDDVTSCALLHFRLFGLQQCQLEYLVPCSGASAVRVACSPLHGHAEDDGMPNRLLVSVTGENYSAI